MQANRSSFVREDQRFEAAIPSPSDSWGRSTSATEMFGKLYSPDGSADCRPATDCSYGASRLSDLHDLPSVLPTPLARVFTVRTTGHPAEAGPWPRVRTGVCQDSSAVIPSFGKETRWEFLYEFQPFKRPTLLWKGRQRWRTICGTMPTAAVSNTNKSGRLTLAMMNRPLRRSHSLPS